MSHPIPGHDYSEQHKHETDREYGHRRATASGRNRTQRMTGKMLKEAGKSIRKEGEAPLQHLKRITRGKAMSKKINETN